MTKDKHIHKFKETKIVVPVHNYVFENGKVTKDLITARDVLKQYVCDCGRIETADLRRHKSWTVSAK